MRVNANIKIAAAIRRVLDRHGDVLETYPEFVREHLVARLDAGASSEVAAYAETLSSSLLERGALVTDAGRFQRDDACLKVFVGHSRAVQCVTALPHGRALSGSDDNTLRLWDLASGRCLRVLKGHARTVKHVAALPDGRALSASGDKTLRLWDLASGECLRVLEGHSDWVSHVAALPDGRALSASADNTLRLWDPTRGDCLAAFTGDDPMISLAVTQKGDIAVVGDHRGRVMVFEIKSMKR